MIYLISGPPRCGKTTLAKRLSKKLGISWISADMLEGIVRSYIPKKDIGRLFPKQRMRNQTKQSNDIMYEMYTAKAIARAYGRQAKVSWKAIEVLVEEQIRYGNNYIIEGHQIHPELLDVLLARHGRENIRSVILMRFDVSDIVSGFLNHRGIDDWVIEKTRNKETYQKIARMIVEYSRFYESEADRYHLHGENLDHRFEEKIESIVGFFSDKK